MSTTLFASTATEPYERGRELGRTFPVQLAQTWRAYQDIFGAYDLSPALVREVAEGSFDAARPWAPDLAAEIEGIAEGAGLETWQVAALNARSEVLACYRLPTPGECSTAVHVPAGEVPRTIQTWDWHEGLIGLTVLWQFEPRPGWTVKTFTELGLLAKIGVNSAGVGLHFNLLKHDADGGTAGVPVHLVARRILAEAASLDEAEAIIRSAHVSASVALTVTDRDDAATFELSPGGVGRVGPNSDRLVLHTNHFLDPDLVPHERLDPDQPGSYTRLERLRERSALLTEPDLARRATAMLSHEEDGAPLCCHPGPTDDLTDQWQTLLTVGLDVDKGRVTFRDGNPCQAGDAWVEV